jgi:tetratricopeptide (TPR) repeat protein
MSRKCRLFLFFAMVLAFVSAGNAQSTLDVADFLKITGNSQVQYEFSLMKHQVKGDFDPGRLNFNYYYRNDSMKVLPFGIDFEATELYEWGLEALMMEEPDTAIVIFQEVLAMFPRYTPALTGIGQAYEQLGQPRKALEFHRQAYTLNPIDYIACWSLARNYHTLGMADSAMNMILRAWVLNRNSLEIKREVVNIFGFRGLILNDWIFIPQYQMARNGDKVSVSYFPAWMGYAICKAVWAYEPGFAAGRQLTGDLSMFQERECLSCLVTSMEGNKKETAGDQSLVAFRVALQQKMALEFILFEILLPYNPDMAYLLDETRMAKMVDYLKMVHIQ